MIAKTIVALNRNGFRYGDIGILPRSVSTSSGPFVAALRRHDIPFRCSNAMTRVLGSQCRKIEASSG